MPTRRLFLAQAAALAACTLRGRGLLAQQAGAFGLKTPAGPLRGEVEDGVRIFRGVSFAEPPVGPLRFRPPVRARRWTVERDATRFAAAAMQPGEASVAKSEDCLYLNIWMPEAEAIRRPEAKGPHPVFVWIHGGGFTGGTAFAPIFDGSGFAREGIVVVTVPYRLGVLGFLDMEPLLGPSYAGSANNGLRDLILALEWVRDNIGAFGGDPGRVTIGGESAGAKLADMLLGIPAARPLFHQAISESGGAERLWPRAAALAVGEGFGEQWLAGGGASFTGMLSAPATALIEAQSAFVSRWPQHFPLRAEIDGRLIPSLPVETIAGGSGRGKRLLIGTNHDESASFLGPHPAQDPTAADLGNVRLAPFAAVLARYRELYPNLTDEQRRIRATTAEEYWVPSVRVADAQVKGGGTVYMYRLDFAESSGRLQGYGYHGLDLPLVWDKPHAEITNAAEEAKLAHPVHQAWVSFVRGEVPGAAGLPPWPEYRPGARLTMALNTETTVEDQPNEAELRLWDGLL